MCGLEQIFLHGFPICGPFIYEADEENVDLTM